MDIDKETQEKIKQLQIFEQNFQTMLMQKQAFQMELTETENALSEIATSKGEVYKMVGQIMIKTDKNKVESELKRKQELLSLRLKTLGKQESELTEQLEELRTEIMKKVK
jgi:prefoldin beta subunit